LPLDGTIGGLVGMLDILRVECPTCNRNGRYHVARLVAELGPDYTLTDWLHKLTVYCPQKNQQGVTRACGAHMPDLSKLRDRTP
jgi:hypothetical protein